MRLNGVFLEHSGTDGTSRKLNVTHEVLRTHGAHEFDADPNTGRLVAYTHFLILVSLGTHLGVELRARPAASLARGVGVRFECVVQPANHHHLAVGIRPRCAFIKEPTEEVL